MNISSVAKVGELAALPRNAAAVGADRAKAPSEPQAVAKAAAQSVAVKPDVHFTNPALAFDPATGTTVREWRDSATGEKEYQIPSRTEIVYRQAQEASDRAANRQPSSQAGGGSDTAGGGSVSLVA